MPQGMGMLLKNQVALITGSGRGIGRAMAQLFAKEGAAVFLTARTEKKLARTAAENTVAGGRAKFFFCDLANWAGFRGALDKVVAGDLRVDILVNTGVA